MRGVPHGFAETGRKGTWSAMNERGMSHRECRPRVPSGIDQESGTLVLATVSALVLTLARLETALSPITLFSEWLIWLSLPWLSWIGLAWRGFKSHRLHRWLPLFLAVWTLLPILAEWGWRVFESGSALELVMLVCLQNAALMTAAFSHQRRCQQVSCILSGFLTLFGLVVRGSIEVFIAACLYGLLWLWWLMARYWDRIQGTHAAAREERCWPIRGSVLVTVGVLLGLVTLAVGSTGTATYALHGFMPTSGGTLWSDAAARSGVGNGDALIAAQDRAESFGPVESELFLESDMPSLFDMFSDLYGDPPKPRKKQERNIALAPQSNFDTEHQHRAETQRSGREFATVRQRSRPRPLAAEERQAPAMLYLVGAAPLHLALERLTEFDGRTWTLGTQQTAPRPLTMRNELGRAWVDLGHTLPDFIRRGTESHALKIINLKSNRIPSPPQLTGLSIDRVDQLDFFGWSSDQVVEMPVRDHVPQLTVIRLRSHGRNYEMLRQSDAAKWFRRWSWDRFPKARNEAEVDPAEAGTLTPSTTQTILEDASRSEPSDAHQPAEGGEPRIGAQLAADRGEAIFAAAPDPVSASQITTRAPTAPPPALDRVVARTLVPDTTAQNDLLQPPFLPSDSIQSQSRNDHDRIGAGDLQSILKNDPLVSRHAACAQQWTAGIPRGWRQVEAVVGRLRTEYQLDPHLEVPAECEDVVGHFLQVKRGPDYLFATTAAILLRGLDYPTRLVTGFYARPERLDRRAGQTAILAEDVHVWVEVGLDRHTWLAIEPTPGYEPPRESLTWRQQAVLCVSLAARWLMRNAFNLILLAIFCTLAWITRIRWIDRLLTTWFTVFPGQHVDRQVVNLLRLLEYRSWLAGNPRPTAIPITTWYDQLARRAHVLASAPDRQQFVSSMHRFLRAAERVLYAPRTQTLGTELTGLEQDRNALRWLRIRLTAMELVPNDRTDGLPHV